MTRPSSAALALYLLLGSVPAAAQPTPDDRRQAREAFRAGEQAFEQNDNEEALRQFRRAFELAPHDAVRFNIGVCLERLGRHREAALEYDTAAASTVLDDAQRAQARSDAERARSRLGTLVVQGTPAGASVLVDGAELCTLPCEVQVDPGRHMVVIRTSAGDSEHSAAVDRGGRTTVVASGGGTAPVDEPIEEEPVDEDGLAHDVRAVPVPESETGGPGWLMWTGAGLAVAGAAGWLVFWLRTDSLHDDYLAMPTAETRDDGLLFRTLTIVSMGVTAVSVVAALVDLLFLAPQEVERERDLSFGLDGVRLRF